MLSSYCAIKRGMDGIFNERRIVNSIDNFNSNTLITEKRIIPRESSASVNTVAGGHWEYIERIDAPYNYSDEVCNATFIRGSDCNGASCPKNLMNWKYHDSSNEPYPTFHVDGFREHMRNKQIMFLGDSTMRQQVQALVWTLGYKIVNWNNRSLGKMNFYCMIDQIGNVTICYQFMGSMATKVYRDGNYTLDLKDYKLEFSFMAERETSFLLEDETINDLAVFDIVFIQGVAWFAGIPGFYNSPTSPRKWIDEILPELYRDVWEVLLTKLSDKTKVVLTLGQTGTSCENKTVPEPYYPELIPNKYSWVISPKLSNLSLDIIKDLSLEVQVVDAREPLMQSVHAHKNTDCLHFFMSSAAVNIYLDMYWNEVFRDYF
ncbi:hypothetical protein ACHAWO_003689 [Cyclotella atomus]|uniref:Uncharacterized protein n=1 Tax=Cyclotella atomus TaxID=382360 RepID=A0ABD3NBH7_9STRA